MLKIRYTSIEISSLEVQMYPTLFYTTGHTGSAPLHMPYKYGTFTLFMMCLQFINMFCDFCQLLVICVSHKSLLLCGDASEALHASNIQPV